MNEPQIRELLTVRMVGLGKIFHKGGSTIEVLKDIDLTVAPGDRISIMGASGVGKSTLLHILATLDHPSYGHVYYNDLDVFSQPHEYLARLRNATVGLVFQFHHLLQEFTALENTMMPAIIGGRPIPQAAELAEEALVAVGLKDRIQHRPGELSGGEQQRVAIARAISLGPQLLLADEPSGNLDVKTGEAVHDLLLSLNEERGITLVVVTHNPDLGARMARRLRLIRGQLVEDSAGSARAEVG